MVQKKSAKQTSEVWRRYLTEVHDDALVHLLPEMSAEDLDQRDLERRDLAVHEDPGEIELDLEADVDVGAVDRWRPPQREATVWNLVETRALRVGQLLVLHRLLKPARLLPVRTTSPRPGYSQTRQYWDPMSSHLGRVSTYPRFVLQTVSKEDQTNDIHLNELSV